MSGNALSEPVSEAVWNAKYRLFRNGKPQETDVRATWSRVALALSQPEPLHRNDWCGRFEGVLQHFRFLPGGRILAGAGTHDHVTLFNCFAAGTMDDTTESVFNTLSEAMQTLQAGGGIGCDFSNLRPAGMPAPKTGALSPGPVSYLHIWNQSSATIASTHRRRGAMMATLRCDHPDIENFIDAKRDPKALVHFNLSVLISDAFMKAVESDAPWPLLFPLDGRPALDEAMVRERIWSGSIKFKPCAVVRTISARLLWQRICNNAREYGDPGVVFIDSVDRLNNLWYAETISVTNPCGEVPLPPHGACNLGSINLTQFVEHPFSAHPHLDLNDIAATAMLAVRMLDNVYDVSSFPLMAQRRAALAARRVGLGITGLADALAMLGVRYGSPASLDVASTIMRTIRDAAYRASIALAQERGAFPAFRAKQYLEAAFMRALPGDIVDGIHRSGIRNSHLTAIAPAGTISLLANNVSSGIEPIHMLEGERSIQLADGIQRLPVRNFAYALFRKTCGAHARLPDALVDVQSIPPGEQLLLQARLQEMVDQSISKTINLTDKVSVEDLFGLAYRLGLKGCTVFRPRMEKEGVQFRKPLVEECDCPVS